MYTDTLTCILTIHTDTYFLMEMHYDRGRKDQTEARLHKEYFHAHAQTYTHIFAYKHTYRHIYKHSKYIDIQANLLLYHAPLL